MFSPEDQSLLNVLIIIKMLRSHRKQKNIIHHKEGPIHMLISS